MGQDLTAALLFERQLSPPPDRTPLCRSGGCFVQIHALTANLSYTWSQFLGGQVGSSTALRVYCSGDEGGAAGGAGVCAVSGVPHSLQNAARGSVPAPH
jgi:hypothetical protein